MKKRLCCLLTALLLCSAFLPACGASVPVRETSKQETYEIWHITDVHYLAAALAEDKPYLTELMAQADGKVTHYIWELMDAFEAEALAARPDAIIFSGDLTLNGGRESHEELAARLQHLKNAGIAVLVIPGNHDLNTTAYRFTQGTAEGFPGISAVEFKEIYRSFGYEDAISRDEDSFSYLYALGPLRFLCLDSNSGVRGSLAKGTLAWAEPRLQQAQAEGCTIIGVTHQNLLTHNAMFGFGYVINNAQAVRELYSQYGITLNLAGHLHIQHIKAAGGITEIDGSSYAVCPNAYGVLRITPGTGISYRAHSTGLAAWAAANGSTDENLLQWESYSAAFFDASNSARLAAAADLPDSVYALFAKIHRDYFAGRVSAEDIALLQASGYAPFPAAYLGSMSPGEDFTVLELPLTGG